MLPHSRRTSKRAARLHLTEGGVVARGCSLPGQSRSQATGAPPAVKRCWRAVAALLPEDGQAEVELQADRSHTAHAARIRTARQGHQRSAWRVGLHRAGDHQEKTDGAATTSTKRTDTGGSARQHRPSSGASSWRSWRAHRGENVPLRRGRKCPPLRTGNEPSPGTERNYVLHGEKTTNGRHARQGGAHRVMAALGMGGRCADASDREGRGDPCRTLPAPRRNRMAPYPSPTGGPPDRGQHTGSGRIGATGLAVQPFQRRFLRGRVRTRHEHRPRTRHAAAAQARRSSSGAHLAKRSASWRDRRCSVPGHEVVVVAGSMRQARKTRLQAAALRALPGEPDAYRKRRQQSRDLQSSGRATKLSVYPSSGKTSTRA